MKIATYIRVSSDEQATEGYSLEVQEESLRKHAINKGWTDVTVYSDDKTGFTLNRPGLQKLLKDARNKKFEIVLVYKIDRLGRRNRDLLNLVHELNILNVKVESMLEPFMNTTTNDGKLMFHLFASLAEHERGRIVDRVLPGMHKSLQEGNWQGGKPPYGYIKKEEKKILAIHPDESNVVKSIYKMYLNNKSISRICRCLNEQGYRTRENIEFYPTLVCDILNNKFYLGKIEWARHTIDKEERERTGRTKAIKNDPKNIILVNGKHQALISQEDFDLVQQKLIANRKGRLLRSSNAGYPLTGILYCGTCNHRFRGASLTASRKTKEKRRYYRCCGNVDHEVNCYNPSLRADEIEPLIFDIIQKIIEHPKIQQGRIEGLNKLDEFSKDEELNTEFKELNNKVSINSDKQKQLWKVHSEGLMTYEVYKNESIDLRAEEKQLRANLAKLELKLIEKEKSENYQILLREVVTQFLTQDNMDLMMIKEFIQLIFKRVVIKDKKIVKLELYEPSDTLLRDLGFDLTDCIAIGKERYTDNGDRRAVG